MDERPLVTTITPTFNGERFIAETIESVLAQTHAAVEHVIIDDASTDGTRKIVARYSERQPERVRLVAFDDRAGPTRRRNDGLDKARGDFIGWLDHDDVWLPEKTAKQLAALREHPGAAVAYSQHELFDDGADVETSTSALRGGGDTLRRLFLEGCFFHSSTALIRRSALAARNLRYRDSHFSWGDDHYMWLELALDWEAVLVDEVLVRVRRHGGNESARLAQENPYPWSIALLDEFVAAHPEAAERLGRDVRVGRGRHNALAAIYELQRGRRLRAASYAIRGALLDPSGAARYARGRLGRAISRT